MRADKTEEWSWTAGEEAMSRDPGGGSLRVGNEGAGTHLGVDMPYGYSN